MSPHLVRFARAYVKPLWRWYGAGSLAVLVTNALSVQVPVQLAAGLDALRAGQPGVGDAALRIGLLGLAILVIRTASRVWFFTPGRIAEFRLRNDMMAHLLRLQPGFYGRFPTGDLLSRATTDVTFARAFAGFSLLTAINVVAALVMSLAQMMWLSPTLTLACALPVAIGFVVVSRGIGRMFTIQRQAQAQLAALSDELLGALQGVASLQAFSVEGPFAARLMGHADALRTSNLGMARLRALVFPILTVAGGVSVWAILAVGGPMAVRGTLSAGELAAFVALLGYLILPIRLLGVLVPVFQRAEASLERIHEVFDAQPERPELPAPESLAHPERGPAIELRDLTYAYPDAPDRPVLQHVSASLPAGGTIGIYGRTGSGKTTLLRLLARLRNPPPGTVFVDGVDLTRLDLDDWRRHLTLVPQAPFLFSETVEENVGLGLPAQSVRHAVEAASLGPDLRALPEGLMTVVGERGIVLSGGQRQRVALARGLVRETELVLLDDVLSAVDHATEQELVRMLEARGRGPRRPTRLVVSHRLSALEHADLVLVLDGGRLVDQGRHAELLARPGPYADAWAAQRGKAS